MRDGIRCQDRILGDRSIHRDPTDLVAVPLGEPHRAIRTGCDIEGVGALRGNRELSNTAIHRNPTDAIPLKLGNPHRTIRTRRNPPRRRTGEFRRLVGFKRPNRPVWSRVGSGSSKCHHRSHKCQHKGAEGYT